MLRKSIEAGFFFRVYEVQYPQILDTLSYLRYSELVRAARSLTVSVIVE